MVYFCRRKLIRPRTVFGFISILAIVSFFLISRMLVKPFPMEMRMSVKDRIQTWDNLAHLVEIGSFSKNLSTKQEKFPFIFDENQSPESSKDFLAVGNSSTSKISLLNLSNIFTIGQTVSFRLDTFNGYYFPQLRGGDDVRVLLTDKLNRRSAVCSVIDLNNGSYIANFKALFNGTLDVRASIVYPREYLQIVISLISRHIGGFASALFEKAGYKEVTLCAPFSALPNYTRTCDFTNENNNLSWYCGHPFNTNLSCSDWKGIRPLTLPGFLPLSLTEHKLINKLFGFPHVKLIPTDLKVHVNRGDNHLREPSSPCNKRTRPFLQSWIEKSPRGWIQGSEWMPLTCRLIHMPETQLMKYLKNVTLLLVGDSDQRGLFKAIHNITKCNLKTSTASPHISSCSKSDWNFKMEVAPDGFPLDMKSQNWIPSSVVSSASDLDKIPAEGNYIILLHHYLSLSPYHPHVYKERIQKTRDAVDRLLQRNQNTFIAVKGPHVVYKSKIDQVIGGDNFVQYYSQILIEEYKRLWNDVLYLDGWDISVAIENRELNLPDFVQFDTARLLLAYACEFFS